MWSSAPAPRLPEAGRPEALRLGLALSPGMRVGLYGGSFNPPHEGHAHVAETARRRLGLQLVVWLVSPQNPLKSARQTAPLAERMASAAEQAEGPSMVVSDLETRMGVNYTVDALRLLKARYPQVRFVWIMGADGLGQFHHWRGWTQILRMVPAAVIARPQVSLQARLAPAARRFARARVPAAASHRLADMAPPAWVFLDGPLNFQSSTRLRERAADRKTAQGA
jgi:nicotinate-nucleotide adenylyltransferase